MVQHQPNHKACQQNHQQDMAYVAAGGSISRSRNIKGMIRVARDWLTTQFLAAGFSSTWDCRCMTGVAQHER